MALLSLAACGPSAGVRPGGGAAPANPEVLLADADAALERGDLPEAAAAYRHAAEISKDEDALAPADPESGASQRQAPES